MNHTASRLLFYGRSVIGDQTGTMVQFAGGEATKSSELLPAVKEQRLSY
jgi:hypothetical protein